MTDLFEDDDLFAPRSSATPSAPPPPRKARPTLAERIGKRADSPTGELAQSVKSAAPPPPRRVAWRENTGEKPRAKPGARVAVELANGSVHENPVGSASPPGWAVEGTRWTLTGSPFDVRRFRLL